MRRQTTSRVLLSVLLLWQLVAGALTHAHGLNVHATHAAASENVASHEAINHELVNHEHCAEMNADMQMDMSLDMTPDTQSQHSSSQADCCQSSGCQCPCVHTVAVAIALPHVFAARPSAQECLEPTPAIRDTGVTGLFRPPI